MIISETECGYIFLNLQREESLHALKAVFTSSQEAKEKDSLRRKVPVFCATGAKPHLVSAQGLKWPLY